MKEGGWTLNYRGFSAMTVTHPLARDAKVWSTAGTKGKARRLLVIVTRLVLDKEDERYKPKHVERLSVAAKEWVEADETGINDFMLINRPKKWVGDKD